jgi:hypothetical protein
MPQVTLPVRARRSKYVQLAVNLSRSIFARPEYRGPRWTILSCWGFRCRRIRIGLSQIDAPRLGQWQAGGEG